MPSQQITDNFIGRSRELRIFTQWLADTDSPWILYFYDAIKEKSKKGGIGKTWLLRQCAMLAKQYQPNIAIVMIDFFDITYRDGIAIAERTGRVELCCRRPRRFAPVPRPLNRTAV